MIAKPPGNHYGKYLPALISLLVAVIFTLPFLLKWDYIGVGDWELFITIMAVPAKTVIHYHQFPFWNPYIGGGNILFAHPEVGILSPFFPLVLLFGAVAGLKLQVLLAYFLGFWGSFLLARKLGLSSIASYLVSFVYFGGSYFALHFSIGHIPFTHFCFLPWLLYFLLQTQGNLKYVLAASITVALIILGNGAAVPFLYTVFFAGVFVIVFSIERKSFALIKAYLFAVVGGLLLAAVKFIPMFYYLSQNKWEGMPSDSTPLALLPPAFFSLNHEIFRQAGSGQYWGWHEYSAYISPLVVLLALVGLIFSFRKCRLWLIIGLFFLIFGMGNFSAISPWNLMMQVPGFSSIRSPARAFQFVILAAAVMGGFGMDYLIEKLKTSMRWVSFPAGILVGLILLGNFLIDLPAFQSIALKKPETVRFAEEFKQEIGRKDRIYDQFLHNRGSLAAPWLSGYRESRGLVTSLNEVLMEYVPEGQLQVLSRNYTPNRVEYYIAPSQAGTIIFGIGYDEGWHAVDGRPVSENNGLVSVRFGINDRRIELYYRTPYFYFGLFITLLALAGGLFLLLNRKAAHRLETVFK
jgi:hypothetical protein